MNETYEEYMNRKLSESVQYKPKDEPTKITLYADDTPYQVIDLKDIDDMSEEEYNDKLKDAWFKKTHYETVEELTWSEILLAIVYWGILFGILIYAIIKVVNGG